MIFKGGMTHTHTHAHPQNVDSYRKTYAWAKRGYAQICIYISSHECTQTNLCTHAETETLNEADTGINTHIQYVMGHSTSA